MQTKLTREDAIALLSKYNKEPFHILHGLTVGGVLKWYANELGYGDEAGFWEICGILHDIDFEEYPEEHCLIAPRLLKEGGAEDEVIHAVCSHGYGIHEWIDAKPEHEMEKVLFAADQIYYWNREQTNWKFWNLPWETIITESMLQRSGRF